MAQTKNPRRVGQTEARAKLVNVRISPQKLNLVAASIRGLPVQKALNELEFSRKRISDDVRKVLYSAVSNAENNHNLDIDNLVVAEAFVGKNLVMKRFASRARGRSSRILKPFSEITIVVREAGEARLMGQKINPIGFRLGVNRTWDSRWFAGGADYARLLHQDLKLRTWLKERLNAAGVSRIIIERPHKKCRVTIYAARPGVVIGKKGADIEKLRKDIAAQTEGEVHLNIVEVRKPETDAQLIAENIAQQLERRIAFRRAMKRAMQSAMRLGAKGVRINVSGRLGGAEIARMEWYREGRVPLHTLRADIDYGFIEAKTTYGIIGVKVWVFKGEVLEHDPMAQDKRWAAEAAGPSSNEGRERGPRRDDRGGRRGREG